MYVFPKKVTILRIYSLTTCTNASLALLTLMFLNIHRLFLMAIPDKVSLILSVLNLLFAEPVLLRLLILILLLMYGILSVLLSHLVVSLVHNLLNSLFIKPCSPLWLIQWGGRILHMDFSNDLALSQVKVTVPITPGGTPDFKWQRRLNGGKNQNPKKSPDQNLTPKTPMLNFRAIKISRQQRQSQNKFGFILYSQS